VQIQMVESVLSDVSNTKSGMFLDLSLLRQSLTLYEWSSIRSSQPSESDSLGTARSYAHGQQLDQRGFTGSVRSENTDSAA
jgi:hypothetical protein